MTTPAKSPSTKQELEDFIEEEQATQSQLNDLADAKKKSTGRKRLTKETIYPTQEPEKGEDSTPTDTGEGLCACCEQIT